MLPEPVSPIWEGSLEGWTKNYAAANHWRIIPHYDLEDLYQDGYLIFLICSRKYAHITEPKHFASLYRTSFTNYIHDLSKIRSGENNYKEENTKQRHDKEQEETSFEDLELFCSELPEDLQGVFRSYLHEGKPERFQKVKGRRESQLDRLTRLFRTIKNWELINSWLLVNIKSIHQQPYLT